MTEHLKNCPFCGSTPNPVRKTQSRGEYDGYNFKVMIECQCGVSVVKNSKQDSGGWCIDKGEAMQEVVSTWNNRIKLDKESA